MVSSCCAYGCTKRYKKGDNIRFFSFPLKNKYRLVKWLIAVRRSNWTPTVTSRICGQHFQSGQPSSDENHPDFVPNIFTFSKPSTSLNSFNRMQKVSKKCCVPQCNSIGWKDPSLHFHPFPNVKLAGELGRRNVIIKKRWILALKIGKEVSDRMSVCSKHFKEEDYIQGSAGTRSHLKEYAVPSLHLPVLPSEIIDDMPDKKKTDEKQAERYVAMESFVKLDMEENVETSEVPTMTSNNEDLVCVAKTTNPNVIRFSVEPNLEQISKNFRENVETSKVPTMASTNEALVCGTNTTNSNEEMHFSVEPNLEQIRESISNFAKERNWEQYHQPRNLLLAMVGEVGELSEIFQWKGEVKEGLPGWSEEEKEHLGQELSDVLLYLVRLSEKCHIDLPAAVMKKMVLNAKKYPATEAWGSSEKYTKYVKKS